MDNEKEKEMKQELSALKKLLFTFVEIDLYILTVIFDENKHIDNLVIIIETILISTNKLFI